MEIRTDKKLFSVAELIRMEEAGLFRDERVELLHGEIFLMSKGSRHQARVDRINFLFARALGGRAIMRIQGPLLVSEYNLPEPDAMLIQPRADYYERQHPTPENVLLLIEISDSSQERDREVKLALYAISGIQEYWIEDIQQGVLLVFRNPVEDRYETCVTLQRSQAIAPLSFPDVQLTVDDILG